MKIMIKQLSGGECTLEVLPTTCISQIKHFIAAKMHIPIQQQKLLHLGRTLADEKTVQTYPTLKDGSKLNLIVKKPEGLYEASINHFKTQGMSEKEAKDAAQRLLKIVQRKFDQFSWDDIERFAMDCMRDENSERLPIGNVTGDEIYGL